MPTVHLALPEGIYNELKSRAAELGIQVTDLIKLYIKMGLDRSYGVGQHDDETLAAISRRVEKLEREFRLKITVTEGRMRELEETLKYIIERLETLEETLSERKARILAERESIRAGSV